MTHRDFLLATLALAGLFPAAALASPNYPGEMQRQLGLEAAPDCTLCHTTPAGGIGTVQTPFGVSMRSRGLRAGDVASLSTALRALEAERTDSDGDAAGDIDELRAGTDPNTAEGIDIADPPSFGCQVAAPASHQLPGIAPLFPLLLGMLLTRLRRRRRRHR